MPKIPRNDEAFNCPHCGAYAHQVRHRLLVKTSLQEPSQIQNFSVTRCSRCAKYSFWHRTTATGSGIPAEPSWQLIYPSTGDAPLPNPDLPDDIQNIYFEARAILAQSPRATAALLRLAIDKLCDHLGAEEKKLNKKIGELVDKGLPSKLQKAFDSLRVTGNHAVHPGQIDVDDIDTAKALFGLVNIITQHMVSEGKQIDDIYDKLPESAKNQISKRDGKE